MKYPTNHVNASPARIGLFGGGFDPPHKGHIQSLLTVRKKLSLDRLYVIPSLQPPLEKPESGAAAFHRLRMAEAAFAPFPFIHVDSRELKWGGKSWSYRTVESFALEYPTTKLFFIIGMDQLNQWDRWKKGDLILEKASLAVTDRPPWRLPQTTKTLPLSIQKKALKESFKTALPLRGGKTVYFCPLLKRTDISSFALRERHISMKNKDFSYIPDSVRQYIQSQGLYSSKGLKEKEALDLALFCQKILQEKKASHIRIWHCNSNAFLIGLSAAGLNPIHGKALGGHVERAVKSKLFLSPLGKEGMQQGRWIALDYGGLAVHIFCGLRRPDFPWKAR